MSKNRAVQPTIQTELTVAEWLAWQDEIEAAFWAAGIIPRDTSLERWAVENGYVTPIEMNEMPVVGYEHVEVWNEIADTVRRWHEISPVLNVRAGRKSGRWFR